MRRVSLLSVILFALSLLITGRSGAAAPFNVLVARDRTEPDVAVDQRHPSTIVIATNTNYDASVGGTYPDGYFTSHDGGRSFLAGNTPVVPPYTTEADPSILIAHNGTVFFTYLAEKPTYCSAAGGSAVEVTASYDEAYLHLKITLDKPDTWWKQKLAIGVDVLPGNNQGIPGYKGVGAASDYAVTFPTTANGKTDTSKIKKLTDSELHLVDFFEKEKGKVAEFKRVTK